MPVAPHTTRPDRRQDPSDDRFAVFRFAHAQSFRTPPHFASEGGKIKIDFATPIGHRQHGDHRLEL